MTRTKPASPEDVVEAVRMLAFLTRTVERACEDGGLSLPQYRVLLRIADRPQRAGEVASQTSVSRPALTGLVDGLEKKGLLRRQSVAGDRRGIRLELTEDGVRTLEATERHLVTKLTEFEDLAGEPGVLAALSDMRRALVAATAAAAAAAATAAGTAATAAAATAAAAARTPS